MQELKELCDSDKVGLMVGALMTLGTCIKQIQLKV
jgi:hypothetical protein